MKMLFVVYDVYFNDDVMAFLADFNVDAFTRWDRVLGKGRKSEPKFDDAVWPGFNRALALVVDDDAVDELFVALEKLSQKLGETGFKVFELPVLRVI